MAKLTSKARNKLPASKFAGPDRSYPIPDKSHARNAAKSKIDARAHKMLKTTKV